MRLKITLPSWQLQVYSILLLPSFVLLNTVEEKRGMPLT